MTMQRGRDLQGGAEVGRVVGVVVVVVSDAFAHILGQRLLGLLPQLQGAQSTGAERRSASGATGGQQTHLR